MAGIPNTVVSFLICAGREAKGRGAPRNEKRLHIIYTLRLAGTIIPPGPSPSGEVSRSDGEGLLFHHLLSIHNHNAFLLFTTDHLTSAEIIDTMLLRIGFNLVNSVIVGICHDA